VERQQKADSQQDRLEQAMRSPLDFTRAALRDDLFAFIEYFWPEVSTEVFISNWHIEVLCDELMAMAHRVANREDAIDCVINIPPGTTKSITCTIMFPAWCWTRWPHFRFITSSYSAELSMEHGEFCRNLIRSERYCELYPHIIVARDAKSNFRLAVRMDDGTVKLGGGRISTSVKGTVTGFHGHINIGDDLLNPHQAASELELYTANRFLDHTLSMRKIDKRVTSMLLIMQRLHEGDCTGHVLAKKKSREVRHICLPARIDREGYDKLVNPPELLGNYVDGLLDPVRMPHPVLDDAEEDLGQLGAAAQLGQNPVPPGGLMFKTERFIIVDAAPQVKAMVRYWDKAGTAELTVPKPGQGPAYTVGTKLGVTQAGQYVVFDVARGRWAAHDREKVIRQVAEADGRQVRIYVEQEPGSGGKESAEATIRNLAGFVVEADRPTGDKVYRADPWSVQVNNRNVLLVRGEWNQEFIKEHQNFPRGRYKDQVDSASGAFGKLTKTKKVAGPLFSGRRRR
jgi:predicted phage terminase large subunit-like protein